MPGPPPPPPMAPPPMMAPPAFIPPKGGPDDRNALLKSIQRGKKLKKTVTIDKSAPSIGKVNSNNNSNLSSSSSSGNVNNSFNSNPVVPNGLVGLFAGGIPKLRPTGKLGSYNDSTTNNNSDDNLRIKPVIYAQPAQKNQSSIQNELKKQLASDNRNRGPPPPAPSRNISEAPSSPRQAPSSPREAPSSPRPTPALYRLNSNGTQTQSIIQLPTNSNLTANSSSLHRNNSNNSLESAGSNGHYPYNKPAISHGKPNLAPKPPLNAKPATPPKRLIINGKAVSRAHSMRSPRSPAPQSPDGTDNVIKYGTVRNFSSVLNQSLGTSLNNLHTKQRPMLNGRPTAPPPSIPVLYPLPPSKTNMKPPNHAPPPPPPGMLPQPPNHAPPPPPYKTLPLKAAFSYGGNLAPPPPPPPRNSSMRELGGNTRRSNLEEQYKDMFHSPNTFPKPPPYRNIVKVYSNRQVLSKQPAPQPPQITTSRHWDTPSTC